MNPKMFVFLTITLFSLPTFAANTINVTVKTNEKTASGIGYYVNGKESGGAGKSYSGKGPANSTYKFGYRKNSAHGANVSCGSHALTKNTNVILVTKGNKCQSIISQ